MKNMNQYITFLRGINISGKNKISMSQLKKSLEQLGFENVQTYLNSGNIVFSTYDEKKEKLSQIIHNMIKNQFGFDIPVYIISQEELIDVVNNAPEWWGK